MSASAFSRQLIMAYHRCLQLQRNEIRFLFSRYITTIDPLCIKKCANKQITKELSLSYKLKSWSSGVSLVQFALSFRNNKVVTVVFCNENRYASLCKIPPLPCFPCTTKVFLEQFPLCQQRQFLIIWDLRIIHQQSRFYDPLFRDWKSSPVALSRFKKIQSGNPHSPQFRKQAKGQSFSCVDSIEMSTHSQSNYYCFCCFSKLKFIASATNE